MATKAARGGRSNAGFTRRRRPAEPRHFAQGASDAAADAAPDGSPRPGGEDPGAPHSRPAKPLTKGRVHDQLADREATSEDRREALLDEGVEESFPASDPVSAHHIS